MAQSSYTADAPHRLESLCHLWRGAAVLYLAVCVLAMAAGLWPDLVYPQPDKLAAAPLPALKTLAVGQAVFFLLIYPLVLLRRGMGILSMRLTGAGPVGLTPEQGQDAPATHGRDAHATRTALAALAEPVVLLVAALPLYWVAAFLADAVALDVARSLLYIVSLVPLSLAAGALLRNPRTRSLAMIAMLVIVLGLPVVYYAALEFTPDADATWLSRLAPCLMVWQNAESRLPAWVPQPLWAWLIWPAAGVAMLLGRAFWVP